MFDMHSRFSRLGLWAVFAPASLIMLGNSHTAVAQVAAATGTQQVRIPFEGNSIDATKLFDAVSAEIHWVAGSITAFTRGFGLESNGMTRLPKSSVDDLVARNPESFRYEGSPDQPTALLVDVDELAKRLADRKSGLRKFLAGVQGSTLTSLDKVESTWKGEPASPPRVVVVMAGLHGTESSAAKVGVKLHEQTNLPVCVFRYPNDGPIFESAGMLVLRLSDFKAEHPNSKITLVTHSMGGLVARAALEMNPTAAGGAAVRQSISDRIGVDQLVQIFPPNHGSALAEYGPLLEGAEQVFRIVNRGGGNRNRVLLRSIVDGFNEATRDLIPNSKFLQELNSQQRNPDVRYSVLIGTAGPMKPALGVLVESIWDTIASSVDEPKEVDRRIRDVVTCDELKQGKGDGVVAIQSAHLPGVADEVQMKMHHLVWNELDSIQGKAMLKFIASRVGLSL